MRRPLRRLLEALETSSLRDLAEAFGVQDSRVARTLVKDLCAQRQVDVPAVLERLIPSELRTACKRLNLRASGDRDDLVERLVRHVGGSGAWRPFEAAREFVSGLGLRSRSEWERFCRGELSNLEALPPDIPRTPAVRYREEGWSGWGDFLGTGHVAPQMRRYRPFEGAREFARALRLPNKRAWVLYCRGAVEHEAGPKPEDIPQVVERVYADAWRGWDDFLGTIQPIWRVRRAGKRAFVSARRFARALELSSREDWSLFCDGALPDKGALPDDIPRNPNVAYRRMGWTNWSDFLGTRRAPRGRKVRSFEAARTYARRLGLPHHGAWNEHCRRLRAEGKLPIDLPANPHEAYRDAGWTSWGDFLGTDNLSPAQRSRQLLPFARARALARTLGLGSHEEWLRFVRGELPDRGLFPSTLPKFPNKTYAAKGWTGWPDFLGYTRRWGRDWRSFEEARRFARSLELSSVREWKRFLRGELPDTPELPADLPRAPDHAYRDEGWVGWEDFLGFVTSRNAPRASPSARRRGSDQDRMRSRR